jgi:hypothetical protein
MSPKPQPDDKLRAQARACAQKAVEKANALRAKLGTRPLPPRDEVRVFQAALNEYLRDRR